MPNSAGQTPARSVLQLSCLALTANEVASSFLARNLYLVLPSLSLVDPLFLFSLARIAAHALLMSCNGESRIS